MSFSNFTSPRGRRNTILASVAVAALAAAGAFADVSLTTSHPAHAAAVVTSDLNAQGAPSFANLIARVKPAVVSVRVKIMEQGNSDSALGDLPPDAVNLHLLKNYIKIKDQHQRDESFHEPAGVYRIIGLQSRDQRGQ